MEIAAVRTGGPRDRVYVTRDDGTQVFWDWSSYGESLPHDLVHYLVEIEFELTDGFWGLVGAGVDPTRVNKAADRIASGVTLRDMTGRNTDQLVVAEALAAAMGTLRHVTATEAIEELEARCDQFGLPVPEGITQERFLDLFDQVERLTTRWLRLPEGTAMELEFPPEPRSEVAPR